MPEKDYSPEQVRMVISADRQLVNLSDRVRGYLTKKEGVTPSDLPDVISDVTECLVHLKRFPEIYENSIISLSTILDGLEGVLLEANINITPSRAVQEEEHPDEGKDQDDDIPF